MPLVDRHQRPGRHDQKFAASFSYHVTCVRYDRNFGIDGPQQVLI